MRDFFLEPSSEKEILGRSVGSTMTDRTLYKMLAAVMLVIAIATCVFVFLEHFKLGLVSVILLILLSNLMHHLRMRRFLSASTSEISRLLKIKTKSIDEAVRKIGQDCSTIESRIDGTVTHQHGERYSGDKLEAGQPGIKAKSRFAPNAVGASKVIARPSVHRGGRLAADLQMNESASEKLSWLLEASGVDQRDARQIAVVGTSKVMGVLEELGDVHNISPGQNQYLMPEELAYLVLDEQAFFEGPWAGCGNAQQSLAALQLITLIKDVKKSGAVVIYVSKGKSGHYIGSFKKLADLIIDKHGSNLDWADDSYFPVANKLMELNSSKGE